MTGDVDGCPPKAYAGRDRHSRSGPMNARLLQVAIGLGCALFFLALALYRAPVTAVGAILAHSNPLWLVAALGAYAVGLALRAWRWQIILRPVATVPYPAVARVLVAGYGFNTIMPARLGELFRVEFFKKAYGLPRVPVLTSIVVERLFDGLAVVGCLASGLLLAAHADRPDAMLIDVATAGGGLFAAILVAALVLSRLPASLLVVRFPRLAEPLAAIGRGLAILRSRPGVDVAVLTLIIYVPDALTLWFVVKACGLSLGPADTLVTLGATALSTMLPSGPAFLGTLQFAYVLAIEYAGGPAAIGVAAATLAQACILLPVAVIATAILAHRSGSALYSRFVGRRTGVSATVSQS
jgi:glycosyltransferase 2 family protein